jgi:hypothetical protein
MFGRILANPYKKIDTTRSIGTIRPRKINKNPDLGLAKRYGIKYRKGAMKIRYKNIHLDISLLSWLILIICHIRKNGVTIKTIQYPNI